MGVQRTDALMPSSCRTVCLSPNLGTQIHRHSAPVQVNQLAGAGSTVQLYEGDVYQFSSLPASLQGSKVLFIATGSRAVLDPLGPFTVDYQGTQNLLAAAQQAKIEHIVLISSIGTDDILFPLNLLFGVLFWKKRAEEVIQRSGIRYTIIRPGELGEIACMVGLGSSEHSVWREYSVAGFRNADQYIRCLWNGADSHSRRLIKFPPTVLGQ